MSKRFKKNTPNKYQKLTSAITLDAPIEERTPFDDAPKIYISDTTYYQTFYIKLKDGTKLLSDVISTDGEPNDEYWSLADPAVIHEHKDGSATVELIGLDSMDTYCELSVDNIELYYEPIYGLSKQSLMLQMQKAA